MNSWELMGLGKAPYRCIGMFETPNAEHATFADYKAPAGFGASGCCRVCGTGLRYNYMIVSADDQKFFVGSECVKKTEQQMLIAEVKKVCKDARVAKAAALKAAATRAKEAAERERNGGMTDNEIYLAGRKAALDEKVKKMFETHGALFNVIRESQNAFGLQVLETCKAIGDISEKQLAVLQEIAAKIQSEAYRVNDFFGSVGERVKSHSVTVEKWITIRPGNYYEQPLFMCIMRDAAGRSFKYFGSSCRCLPAEGDTAAIAFTVKKHNVHKDICDTVIQRPKILS